MQTFLKNASHTEGRELQAYQMFRLTDNHMIYDSYSRIRIRIGILCDYYKTIFVIVLVFVFLYMY